PVARGVQFLSNDEQEIATQLGHAQLRYETAMAGLRGAGSPQMFPRFQAMIGSVDKATTPASLNRLAYMMEDYIDTLDRGERASGRAGFPSLIQDIRGKTPLTPRSSGQQIRI